MSKRGILLFIIWCCVAGYVLMEVAPSTHSVEIIPGEQAAPGLPFESGEQFTYEVRYKGAKIGKSTLTFHGERFLDDKKAYYITFNTNVLSLKDREEIYADPDTFLPIEVHRNIKKKIGFDDKIKEVYDQKNFRVDISSKSKLRAKEFSIEKDSPIHNAILLIYCYRAKKDFDKSEKLKINLPTLDFEVAFSGIETVETKLGEYRAYVFTSDPPRFKFWLSADERRIPLKIKNPGNLDYSLILKSID